MSPNNVSSIQAPLYHGQNAPEKPVEESHDIGAKFPPPLSHGRAFKRHCRGGVLVPWCPILRPPDDYNCLVMVEDEDIQEAT